MTIRSKTKKDDFSEFQLFSRQLLLIKNLFSSFFSYFSNVLKLNRFGQDCNNLFNSALLYNNTSDGILITDAQHKIIGINEAFSSITGYSEDEAIGQTPGFLQSGRHNKHFYQQLWLCVIESGHWQGEIWNKRKNGEIFPELLTINVIKNDTGNIAYHMGVFTDISQVEIIDENLNHLAFHDHLTGLPNRLMLEKRMNQAMICANNTHLSFALLFIDFDGFKIVNDTYGHTFGDSILNMAAHRLHNTKRQSDFLARVGGDEFIMIITSLATEEIIPNIARNIIDCMKLPFHLDTQSIVIGASIGISIYPDFSTNSNELIKQADSAMYQAKLLGRNNFAFFERHFN